MSYLVAAVVFLGVLSIVNLLLTLAVVRRLREHAALLQKVPMPPPFTPPGTKVPDLAATLTSLIGEQPGTTVVGMFSTSCASCEEHLPEFVERVRSIDPYVQIILQTGYAGDHPPRTLLAALDIQGYHDKADGPERLLLWVDVALKAHRMITELRERERLQSEIVANCSHEFRTPLNIIAGYAELMQAGDFGTMPSSAASTTSSGAAEITQKSNRCPSMPCANIRTNRSTLRLSRTRRPTSSRSLRHS